MAQCHEDKDTGTHKTGQGAQWGPSECSAGRGGGSPTAVAAMWTLMAWLAPGDYTLASSLLDKKPLAS
ncbi:unnamed protein product [Boreogadus saida]